MYVVERLDKDRVQEMSKHIINPHNLNIYHRSKNFESKPELVPQEDRWYKTKYGKEKFSEKLLNLITNPNSKGSGKKHLDLPPANNLLPKNLDVLPVAQEGDKPYLLQKWADDTDLWFMKDDKFLRPKGIVSLKIYTGDCEFGMTPRGRVFVEVWN